ncbi:MAG: hypothetical protein QOH73_2052 [Gaiellaceae bacterium]|jgi:hypothetical protein|nr:hypothetical protein [Gaiellaceae bacterium]
MSAPPATTVSPDRKVVEALAGFMAAAAIFLALMGLAYRPVRMTALAALLALVATGIGGRNTRLAAIALFVAGACWMVGLAIAILSGHPLY